MSDYEEKALAAKDKILSLLEREKIEPEHAFGAFCGLVASVGLVRGSTPDQIENSVGECINATLRHLGRTRESFEQPAKEYNPSPSEIAKVLAGCRTEMSPATWKAAREVAELLEEIEWEDPTDSDGFKRDIGLAFFEYYREMAIDIVLRAKVCEPCQSRMADVSKRMNENVMATKVGEA